MIAAGIMALAIGTFPASLKASCTDIKEEKPAIHRLKGRIIDQDGASVEYVAVGIPGSRTGTVSSADGKFELEIPADETDSLVFRHVSYMTERIPASEYMHTDTMSVRLTGNEIDVAVVYPAETKEKTLVSKGARFPAAFGVFNPDDTGTEVGSNVKVKKRFIIKKFSFKVAE